MTDDKILPVVADVLGAPITATITEDGAIEIDCGGGVILFLCEEDGRWAYRVFHADGGPYLAAGPIDDKVDADFAVREALRFAEQT